MGISPGLRVLRPETREKLIDETLSWLPFKVPFIYLAARRSVRTFPFDLAPTDLHNDSLNVLHLLWFAFVIRQCLDQDSVSPARPCQDRPSTSICRRLPQEVGYTNFAIGKSSKIGNVFWFLMTEPASPEGICLWLPFQFLLRSFLVYSIWFCVKQNYYISTNIFWQNLLMQLML